jgi:Holliday junction resolvase RusA-like endonuclease
VRDADTVVLVVDDIPWGGNARKRRHWADLARHDRLWRDAVWRLAVDTRNRRRLAVLDRAAVRITFGFPTARRRDIDNWTAATKGIVDGLVGTLVVDDDTDHMTLEVVIGHSPTRRTTIEIRGDWGLTHPATGATIP